MPAGLGADGEGTPGHSPAPLLPAAIPAAAMWNIFKKNQEPGVAPATTTVPMPVGPPDNSTESGGAGESKEDMFAKLREKFFNEVNKIPRECPRDGALGARAHLLGSKSWFRLDGWGALSVTGGVGWLTEGSRGTPWPDFPGKNLLTEFRKLSKGEAERRCKAVRPRPAPRGPHETTVVGDRK